MDRKPQYPKLAPGQPPQLVTYADPPAAYCIRCGQPITQYAPQRPMSVNCWDEYRYLPLPLFRTSPQRYCHRTRVSHGGARHHFWLFVLPLCGDCSETQMVA